MSSKEIKNLRANNAQHLKRISYLEDEVSGLIAYADLNVLKGQITGLEFVKDSLCSCEIKPTGQEWLVKQIDERKIRLKKLEDERTSKP